MFDRLADRKIRDAMAAGEFDDLPGRGQTIDLEDYFATPEHLRMAHSILKSAGCLPEEVELINEIATLDRQLAGETDEGARQPIEKRLHDLRLRLRMLFEGARRR